MPEITKYFLIIALVFFGISCTEEIDIELDSTYTRLIVFGEINTDTTEHIVRLSYSSDYLVEEPSIGIENASVELMYNNTSLLLNYEGDGIYKTNPGFYGVPGTTYHLKISDIDINNDGENEVYEASATMPFIGTMDSIALKYSSNSFYSGWEVLVYAWDPPGIKNYYSFKTYKNGILQTDTLSEFIVQSDDFFDGNYTYGITSQFIDDQKVNEKAVPGDTISFEMNGITEEYFKFIIDAQAESFGSVPLFGGPPANISSNISNGALGFFTASAVERKSIIVPEYPL